MGEHTQSFGGKDAVFGLGLGMVAGAVLGLLPRRFAAASHRARTSAPVGRRFRAVAVCPPPARLPSLYTVAMSPLAPSGSSDLLVFTAPGCSLCEKALVDLVPLAAELGFAVRVVDIADDSVLEARYRRRIPVGELGGRVVFKFRLDEARLRRVWAEEVGRRRV